MAASAAVLGTVELFEEILSFLNIAELTRAQRVSRAWQLFILSSPSLKRTLFFELQLGAVIPSLWRQRGEHGSLMKQLCITFDQDGDHQESCFPILRFAPPVSARAQGRKHDPFWTKKDRRKKEVLTIDLRQLLIPAPGIWEEMRLTQPLLKSIEVTFKTVAVANLPGEDFWHSLHRTKATIKNGDGLRIADLTKKMRSLMAEYTLATGKEVRLTSYLDVSFASSRYAFEGSYEVLKGLRGGTQWNMDLLLRSLSPGP